MGQRVLIFAAIGLVFLDAVLVAEESVGTHFYYQDPIIRNSLESAGKTWVHEITEITKAPTKSISMAFTPPFLAPALEVGIATHSALDEARQTYEAGIVKRTNELLVGTSIRTVLTDDTRTVAEKNAAKRMETDVRHFVSQVISGGGTVLKTANGETQLVPPVGKEPLKLPTGGLTILRTMPDKTDPIEVGTKFKSKYGQVVVPPGYGLKFHGNDELSYFIPATEEEKKALQVQRDIFKSRPGYLDTPFDLTMTRDLGSVDGKDIRERTKLLEDWNKDGKAGEAQKKSEQ